MMLQETKIELMKEGMTIHEGYTPDGKLAITILKFDFDGLRVEATNTLEEDVFLSEEDYNDTIKHYALLINEHISMRAVRDVNTCQHQFCLIGKEQRKVCTQCRINTGEKMVFLNNN